MGLIAHSNGAIKRKIKVQINNKKGKNSPDKHYYIFMLIVQDILNYSNLLKWSDPVIGGHTAMTNWPTPIFAIRTF